MLPRCADTNCNTCRSSDHLRRSRGSRSISYVLLDLLLCRSSFASLPGTAALPVLLRRSSGAVAKLTLLSFDGPLLVLPATPECLRASWLLWRICSPAYAGGGASLSLYFFFKVSSVILYASFDGSPRAAAAAL